jgi:hypothetical protein
LKYSQHNADGTFLGWGQGDEKSHYTLVDVVCSNAERISKIDDDWRQFVSEAMSEGECEDEDDGQVT